MPYESLVYNETLMTGILAMALFAIFAIVTVMIFISIRDSRKNRPLLRPVIVPREISTAVEDIDSAGAFYRHNTSYLLESRKAVSEMLPKGELGLLHIKNTGNCAAVDVEVREFGDYYVSDGPETRPVTIGAGQSHSFLFFLHEDMVNDLRLYPVRLKYRNIDGKRFSEAFHVSMNPGPGIKMEDGSVLRIYLQI